MYFILYVTFVKLCQVLLFLSKIPDSPNKEAEQPIARQERHRWSCQVGRKNRRRRTEEGEAEKGELFNAALHWKLIGRGRKRRIVQCCYIGKRDKAIQQNLSSVEPSSGS